MRISVAHARELADAILRGEGFTSDQALVITEHLLDYHFHGHNFGGLPRLLVVLDRVRTLKPGDIGRVELIQEGSSSIWIDGHDNLGYLTCQTALDMGIAKISAGSPVVVVGVKNTSYSGRLGYFAEQAAKQGIVAIHMNSAYPIVAAEGGRKAVLGTNPICIAFPTATDPVVCDMTTAAMTWGEVQVKERAGEQLPAGVAIDASGNPTTEASKALAGALRPWGGHKGYALSLAIGALGVLAGGDAAPKKFGNWGHLFILIRSDIFRSADDFVVEMSRLTDVVESSSGAVRIPGWRSAENARRERERGTVEVPDETYADLVHLAESLR
jgi:LDH2 family malate/lactate/ureidoglycolate dehydrogenase